MRKQLAAFGLTAGLAVGGIAGFAFTSGSVGAGAQDGTTTSTVPVPDRPAKADRGDRLREVLKPLVDDKTLTQAQADKVVEALLAAGPQGGPGGRGDHGGPGGPGRHGMPGLEAAATALGLSADDLASQLRDGTSIKDIAAAKGVEVSKVIDALVAEATARIDERVKAGDITQEQADARTAKLTERITAFVNGERPPGGPGRDGGPGHDDPPADN